MQSTATSKRMPLVIRESYQIDLEYSETLAILHLPRVDKLTKTVYKDIKEVSESISVFLSTMGYEHVYVSCWPEDFKTKKLVSKLGFKYQGYSQGFDVYVTGV